MPSGGTSAVLMITMSAGFSQYSALYVRYWDLDDSSQNYSGGQEPSGSYSFSLTRNKLSISCSGKSSSPQITITPYIDGGIYYKPYGGSDTLADLTANNQISFNLWASTCLVTLG